MNNQPFVTIQSKPTPNYHEIALNNAAVISDFSKVLDDRNKEIAELRDALRQLYHNHGHGNYDEACGLWGVIGAQKRPDEACIHRFWGVKSEGGEG